MPAYLRTRLDDFAEASPDAIVGILQRQYAADGFVSQYVRQTKAWECAVDLFQASVRRLIAVRPDAKEWEILLEYPLYRLRRRIDVVILACDTAVIFETKIGAALYSAADRRQVEEYALDLRDFHALSRDLPIVPVLWSTGANQRSAGCGELEFPLPSGVSPVITVGSEGPVGLLERLGTCPVQQIIGELWDNSPYRPVPNVIEAATSIFAGHDVRSIANADADNLKVASARLVSLIEEARAKGQRALLMLTGVPGSGKTLAGLDVVHSAIATGVESQGDIVYLSGNTPLVTVLREALSQDEHTRRRARGDRTSLEVTRREIRARIQHINDFLQQSLLGQREDPPHEHVIVFDEAQRAWDEKQGMEKFKRTASEPAILLELMSRHTGWCACVCLIGGGQEINAGEDGVYGWGEALRGLSPQQKQR